MTIREFADEVIKVIGERAKPVRVSGASAEDREAAKIEVGVYLDACKLVDDVCEKFALSNPDPMSLLNVISSLEDRLADAQKGQEAESRGSDLFRQQLQETEKLVRDLNREISAKNVEINRLKSIMSDVRALLHTLGTAVGQTAYLLPYNEEIPF